MRGPGQVAAAKLPEDFTEVRSIAGDPVMDVVVTTIGDGAFLGRFKEVLASGSLRERVRMVVIPDRRTPKQLYAAAGDLAASGVEVVCPDPAEQEELLAAWGVPDLFPWDSDNRRNIGYAIAWRDGRDLVISVDDDNLPQGGDFFDHHAEAVTCEIAQGLEVSSSSGWFNCCTLLDCKPHGPSEVWPRGFPYRHRKAAEVSYSSSSSRVAVNAGLWLGDPDVDALTRLALRPLSTDLVGSPVTLDRSTWCPVNSQNTAVRRDALIAYYFVRMGWRVGGARLERFGDILSGLFVEACAKHRGETVRFGGPCAVHDRNEHDLLADAEAELPAIVLMEDVADWLTSYRLEGSSYGEAYESLAAGLDDAAELLEGPRWGREARDFIHGVAACMRQWITLMVRLAG